MERSIEAQPSELSVCIGLPTGPTMPWQTAMSIASTVKECLLKGIPLDMKVVAGASIVTEARDQVLTEYLKTDCSRLFWVDSDIVWNAEDFIRMVVLSTQMPVVAAAYPRKVPHAPLVILPAGEGEKVTNEYGCELIGGTGLGFTVMRREVVEAVAKDALRTYNEVAQADVLEVFRTDTIIRNGKMVRRGEDMAFFEDIRAAGYEVWLDPTVKLGHVGSYIYRSRV